ncbi:unnamed protein product [Candidula unifasciata]|uniref:XK-related protein n=1 Tax=Candidula unifasciata TaxID=100452 RepID=A0A8S3YRC7_9EUPU|nr:unnamed protein product [Candidula unifasciata]
MSPSKLSTRFVIFVIVSLMTHLLELAASGVFCHTLMQQADLRMPWFSVAAGLLILPVVAIQLASAVFLLKRKGETFTSCEIATTAILHVLQLGFISRHFIILRETSLSSKRKEITEMMLLRVCFAFTSGSTLLFVQVYLLLQGPLEGTWIWTVYFSGVTNLISVAWAVSTSQKSLPDHEFSALLITWPGSLFKIFWRAGELLARILSAALFASLYMRFLFLVLGLHWLSMLVCLYIPLITSIQWPACGSFKKTLIRLMISFTHIFTFINTSVENSVFRFTFYYVIFFLENATLITVWFVQSSAEYFSRNSIFAYVAVVSFIVSVTSMIIYYKYVHIPVSKASPVRTCDNSFCMACNPTDGSNCQSGPGQQGVTKSNTSLTEAPISLCSYQLQQKHYFVQDGANECNGCANTKGRSCRHNGSSLSQSNTENTSSSLEDDKNHSNKHEYTALELKFGSAGVHTEQVSCQLSQKQPVWLPSGDSNFTNQLLTYTLDNFDAAETADSERSSDVTECVGYTSSRLPPPQTAAYEQNSVAGTSKTSQQVNQQKPSQKLTPKIGQADVYDSENMCSCACSCSYEVPEIAPPEHGVSSVPESPNTRTTETVVLPCLQADIHCHHRHHHHHRASYKNTSSVILNENLPSLDTENKNTNPSKDVHQAQECISCIQPPMVSGPGCYKNKKRKHSQKRKLHISTVVDTFTTLSTSTEQHSMGSNPAQNYICLPSKNIDLSPAQNDQLAIELLKSSFHSENQNHAVENTPDIASVPTSDPRFSVRVMTSPVPENSTCVSLVSSNTSHKIMNTSRDNVREYSEPGQRKHQQTETENRKTLNAGSCLLAGVVSRPENESCLVVSNRVRDEVSLDTTNRKDLPNDREDNVYENLWPSEGKNKLKPSKGWDIYRTADVGAPRKLEKREIYSESEDSALPMEFLSSSAEVFTGSNSDSDISLEIVI